MRDLKTLLNDIVTDYCNEFDVKPKDLFRDINRGSARTKVVKKTNISALRMALGYYFTREFGLPKTFACKFVGYATHSTMSHNEEKIKWFIETEDIIFMYYYNQLKKVVEKYQDDISMLKRVVLKP